MEKGEENVYPWNSVLGWSGAAEYWQQKRKVKKVSFRVRRIYYDQFVNGTKDEELRAWTSYWRQILLDKENPPKIAVVHTPKQPALRFQITRIFVVKDISEYLGRELSKQGKKDISTQRAIVTKMGERIK
ncbi:unnamed protein product [marine sediment metagenome]|uniref:Uncharacterized protein n=1 Tax=marine sediment metagenome TaxID=412755 RepID=X1EXY6_9ZZZZ